MLIKVTTAVQEKYGLEPVATVEDGFTGEHGDKAVYVSLAAGSFFSVSPDEARELAAAMLKAADAAEGR
jgi:hypothetical protein